MHHSQGSTTSEIHIPHGLAGLATRNASLRDNIVINYNIYGGNIVIHGQQAKPTHDSNKTETIDEVDTKPYNQKPTNYLFNKLKIKINKNKIPLFELIRLKLKFLKELNEYRAKYGAPALTLNDEKCKICQMKAESRVNTNISFETQNDFITYIYLPNETGFSGRESVDSWFENGYSTLIQANTEEVGVGFAKFDDGKFLVVVKFLPENLTNNIYTERDNKEQSNFAHHKSFHEHDQMLF